MENIPFMPECHWAGRPEVIRTTAKRLRLVGDLQTRHASKAMACSGALVHELLEHVIGGKYLCIIAMQIRKCHQVHFISAAPSPTKILAGDWGCAWFFACR